MSKIHLEIEIPGNAKTYEFMLDDRMKIGTAKQQIMKQIAELEGHDLFAGLDNIVFGSVELEGLIQELKTAAGWLWCNVDRHYTAPVRCHAKRDKLPNRTVRIPQRAPCPKDMD